MSEPPAEHANSLPLDGLIVIEDAPAVPRWKRLMDLLVLIGLAPLWISLVFLISVVLLSVNGGPVFFRQIRVGRGGRAFALYKFRTMTTDADPTVYQEHITQLIRTDTPMTKLDHMGDVRLVRFGRFLRASGLDELPQIWNVIRGDMSLVGPRPSTQAECALYSRYERGRLRALPGITGWWQVNGKNETTFQRMIELDNAYCDRLTWSRDFLILLRTTGVIGEQLAHWLKRRGAPHEELPSDRSESPNR